MTDGVKFQVDKLAESNWDYWCRSMVCILQEQNLLDLVEGSVVEPLPPGVGATQDQVHAYEQRLGEFKQKKFKALRIIVPAVSPELTHLLPRRPTDPCEIWKKLEEHFDSQSTFNAVHIERELAHLILTEKEDPVPWMQKRMKLYQRLATCDEAVKEKKQCIATLALLPSSYRSLEQSISTLLSKDELTMNQLCDRLRLFKLDSQGSKSSESAYAAGGNSSGQKSKGRYSGGGFQGKRANMHGSNYKQKQFSGSYSNMKTVCWSCGGKGHVKMECPSSRKRQNFQAGRADIANEEAGLNAFALPVTGDNKELVIMDSGATSHMCPVKDAFTEFALLNPHQNVKLGDGYVVHATGVGKVGIDLYLEHGKKTSTVLLDCLYVPELKFTLFSVSSTTKGNKRSVKFMETQAFVEDKQNKSLVACGTKKNGIFFLDCALRKIGEISGKISQANFCGNCAKEVGSDANLPSMGGEQATVVENKTCDTAGLSKRLSLDVWHCRFGHLNAKSLQDMANGNKVKGFDLKGKKELMFCEACPAGKLHELPYPQKTTTTSNDVLELMHSDVCGPFTPESLGGKKYMVTFIDDFSRAVWVKFLRNKSEVFIQFKELITELERTTGKKLKAFRSDRGGEYMSDEFNDFLKLHGIRRELSAADAKPQNGVAERMNRTLCEKARCMMEMAKISRCFWAEAVANAVYVTNRCPASSLEGNITPYEAWLKRKPAVKHLRVFGCPAYSFISKQRRKWDSKSERCIFLGYDLISKAYRLWSTEKLCVIIRRNVVFDESGVGQRFAEKEIVFKSGYLELDVAPIKPSETQGNENLSDNQSDNSNVNHEGQTSLPIRRTARTTAGNPPVRYPRYDTLIAGFSAAFVTDVFVSEPKTWKEAMESEHSKEWKNAADAEFRSLQKHGTWSLVPLPPGKDAVGGKWVFRAKHNEAGEIERFKARFVAQGFGQRYGQDYTEIFSPVVRWESVRMLLSLAANFKMKIHQLDVETAFLNGWLKEEVYMKQPEGFIKTGEENLV